MEPRLRAGLQVSRHVGIIGRIAVPALYAQSLLDSHPQLSAIARLSGLAMDSRGPLTITLYDEAILGAWARGPGLLVGQMNKGRTSTARILFDPTMRLATRKNKHPLHEPEASIRDTAHWQRSTSHHRRKLCNRELIVTLDSPPPGLKDPQHTKSRAEDLTPGEQKLVDKYLTIIGNLNVPQDQELVEKERYIYAFILEHLKCRDRRLVRTNTLCVKSQGFESTPNLRDPIIDANAASESFPSLWGRSSRKQTSFA
jgi:hypothetical protein